MRLTTIGRALGATAVFVAASLAVLGSRDFLAPLFISDATADRRELGGTTRVLVYRVPETGVLQFNLSRPSPLLRITSQPNIDPEDWERSDNWIYGFRVTLRDADGTVVLEQDIYSRSLHPRRLRPFKRPIRFRLDSDVPIALRDEVVIEAERPVALAELSPLQADAGVVGVDVQVYERLPFVGNSALAAFRRRTEAEQQSLARADAFGLALLSDRERAALMTNRWKVLGPTGIAGRDYTVGVVYERPFLAEDEEEQ